MRKLSFREIIFERRHRLLRHVLLWTIIFVVMTLLDYNERSKLSVSVAIFFVYFPVLLLYAYVITYWLIPSYLLKGKYLTFFLLYCCWCPIGLIMIFLDTYYVFYPLYNVPTPHFTLLEAYKLTFAVERFVRINLFAIFCVFIKFFKYWYSEQEQKMKIEKEKINAELELLRAQLQPHFLFNTLNNLYTLVYEKSEKAPGMLMRLSRLLSYVLYECRADEVLLTKEIDAMKNYVALEHERYGERLEVSLNFSGDIEDRMIAPMIFQPFIENAFKHGISEQLGKTWMSIDLSVKNNQLYFKVINSRDVHADNDTTHAGIGINNVKKRLALLYPSKNHLHYGVEDDVFIVSLVIELNPLLPQQNIMEKNTIALKHA